MVGTRVRVTANSGGLVVDGQQGGSWKLYVRLDWDEIVKAYFTVGTYDPLVALYATTRGGKREHLVDSRQLNDKQWKDVVSAVAAWTSGRVVIDPSTRADPRSITDF